MTSGPHDPVSSEAQQRHAQGDHHPKMDPGELDKSRDRSSSPIVVHLQSIADVLAGHQDIDQVILKAGFR